MKGKTHNSGGSGGLGLKLGLAKVVLLGQKVLGGLSNISKLGGSHFTKRKGKEKKEFHFNQKDPEQMETTSTQKKFRNKEGKLSDLERKRKKKGREKSKREGDRENFTFPTKRKRRRKEEEKNGKILPKFSQVL